MSEVHASNMAVNGSEAEEILASSLSKTPPPVVQISRVKEEGRATDGSEIDSIDSQASISDSDDEQFEDAEEDLNIENKENGLKQNEKKSKSDIENNNKEWQPPDEELQEKVVKQVEFYFSDANITKDAFLLKHVKRNREGYVSLKLITSFKKVKKLTKDWRSVRYSLQQKSVSLIVNPDGKKVKRKEPLPEYDETTPSRTVMVVNLPFQNPTIENVNELFKQCGEISLVRIIRPGKTIPQDVRKHMGKHYEIGNTLCALVEFEKSESATNAVKLMNNDDNWRTSMHVTLLAPKKNKKEALKKEDGRESLSPQQKLLTPVGSGAESDGSMKGDEKRRRRQKRKKNRIEELTHEGDNSSSEPDLSPSPGRRQQSKPVAIPPARSPNHLSPATTPRSSPINSPHSSPRVQKKIIGRSPLAESNRGSPKNSPKGSPESGHKYTEGSLSEGSGSPWVRRRRLLAAESSSPIGGNSPSGSPSLMRHSAALCGIIRNPRGPDGTHGFADCKGRGKFIPVC